MGMLLILHLTVAYIFDIHIFILVVCDVVSGYLIVKILGKVDKTRKMLRDIMGECLSRNMYTVKPFRGEQRE